MKDSPFASFLNAEKNTAGMFSETIRNFTRSDLRIEKPKPFTPPPRPTGPPTKRIPFDDPELVRFCEFMRDVHETTDQPDYGYGLREEILRPLDLLYTGGPVLTSELEYALKGVESWIQIEQRNPGFIPANIGALLPEAWHRLTDEIRGRKLKAEAIPQKRNARRNAATRDDRADITAAVKSAIKLRKGECSSWESACMAAIEKHELTISARGLERHVRKTMNRPTS